MRISSCAGEFVCQLALTPQSQLSAILSSSVEGRDALELKEQLASRGIIVRHYSSPPSISGCLRISVGKPKHTDALRDALENLGAGNQISGSASEWRPVYGPRGFTYPKHLIMRNLTQICISLFSITLRIFTSFRCWLRLCTSEIHRIWWANIYLSSNIEFCNAETTITVESYLRSYLRILWRDPRIVEGTNEGNEYRTILPSYLRTKVPS